MEYKYGFELASIRKENSKSYLKVWELLFNYLPTVHK